jgi:hypothetical protein
VKASRSAKRSLLRYRSWTTILVLALMVAGTGLSTGNEPDVQWQDNVTPAEYAQLYHDLYAALKAHDPGCKVAIGGVSQPTPLRMQYLDLALAEYESRFGEPMPVDVRTVHNYVLREEQGSWGVGTPPGIAEKVGVLRELTDHDNLALFGQQLVDFRRWMKKHDQQNKELLLTEYGILMPADYGFSAQRVERFMLDSFGILLSATDPDMGYPPDDYRLVQRWCWFSLADRRYPTSDLARRQGEGLTSLGQAFSIFAHTQRP